MNTFSIADLNHLIEQPRQLALSLYMPTHRGGPQTQQNYTRLHNLLRAAETQLIALDVGEQQRTLLLAPLHHLLHAPDQMQTGDGLALFVAPNVVRTYHLPIAFAEQVAINTRFHVTPLLPLLTMQHPWAVLALSQHEVRLLRGTRDALHEVPLPDVPHSLAEALRDDEFEKQHQLHPGVGTHGSRGARGAIFHGQGDHNDVAKEELLRFFRMVDRGVGHALADDRVPLVLAGVAYELAIYREVSSYSQIVDGAVSGNPDDLRSDELAERTWPLVAPIFTATQHDAINRYVALAGTGRTSTDLREIVPAAHAGRIDTALIAIGQHVWGGFDAADEGVRISVEREPGDEDLLNMLVAATLANHGTVHAVPPDQMPVAASVAAIFRY